MRATPQKKTHSNIFPTSKPFFLKNKLFIGKESSKEVAELQDNVIQYKSGRARKTHNSKKESFQQSPQSVRKTHNSRKEFFQQSPERLNKRKEKLANSDYVDITYDSHQDHLCI